MIINQMVTNMTKITLEERLTVESRYAPPHKVYKKSGCFNLTGVVFVPKDQVNPDEEISIAKASLPITSDEFDQSGAAGYRHPNLIPALSDNNFLNIAPLIQQHANKNNLAFLPAIFFYRPPEVNDVLGEDGLLKDLSRALRDKKVTDRLFIDLNSQSEPHMMLNPLRDHCVAVLNHAKVDLPRYLYEGDAKLDLINLLQDYPFLVHHVFYALPNLRVLRHRVKVLGKEQPINHLIYNPNWVQDIDTERLRRLDNLKVVP